MEAVLEAATRVFRREGFRATTNRIAKEAGVSIGSLYEYFADKQALLAALAEHHVTLAEAELDLALRETRSVARLLAAVQRAVLASQRYPSEALEFLSRSAEQPLRTRANALRQRAIASIASILTRVGHPPSVAAVRAQAVFGAIGDLTVHAWLRDPGGYGPLARELLGMATRYAQPLPGEYEPRP